MCDRGLAEDMYEVAQRDDTTINALTILHNHDYDCKRAIQALVKCPIPKGIDRKWSDDDQKKFIKGLRQYGKNFFRIRKDLLSHKQTSDLVEFYYLWKKTPQAQSSRPRRRQRPSSTLANVSTTPTPTKQRGAKSSNKDDSDDDNPNSTELDSSPYLFKPLNESCASAGKRKRTKAPPSPDEYSSSLTRSKKKVRGNERLTAIKQEAEDESDEIVVKKEEQENEKPSSSSTIKTEDHGATILTPTPCKQELHSPTSILFDHGKQNSSKLLLSSPSSAFSRTSRKSLLANDADENLSHRKDAAFIPSPKDDDPSNDDGNTSDSSTNANPEASEDDGPMPSACEKECYKKAQGIVLLQVYNRSLSQNSCARTDIVLKRGSRTRAKPVDPHETTSSTSTKTITKQDDRNPSKFAFSLDKGPSMLHSPVPPFPPSDPLQLNHNNPLFHPLPMHAFAGANKPPLGFPSPFGLPPSPHENAALRHLDPLALRMINPSVFARQSPFASNLGRPPPAGLDPTAAALLLDSRYRSLIPPSSSNHVANNGTHNHAHIHSHSHTHLHLNNAVESALAGTTPNGLTLPPPPLLPFANPLSGLSHGNPLLHPSGSFSPLSLDAMHNLTRERELMTMMLGNNNRFDPATLALASSLQMPRLDELARLNARERSMRDHNDLRLFGFDMDRRHFR